MKKIYFLLIVVLFLTGCSSVVNINIDKNSVTETVKIYESNSSQYNEIKNWNGFPAPLYYDQELEAPLWMPNRKKESGVSYYDVKYLNKSIEITGNFSINDHSRSSLVRNCFRYYNVITEGQKTIFSTSKGLTCSYRNFSIVVSTPYVVISNNADRVDNENNTYTWNINNSNYRNAGIYLEIDFSKKYNESSANDTDRQEKKDNESLTYIYLILGIVIALLVLSVIYLYNKKRNLSDQ